MNPKKFKRIVLAALPYVIFGYIGDLIACAYRTAEGSGFQEKFLPFLNNMRIVFAD